jgi:hypothetical protein
MNKMKYYCFKHNKNIEGRIECNDYFFNGAHYHGMGIHPSCLTCKHIFIYYSDIELTAEKKKRAP